MYNSKLLFHEILEMYQYLKRATQLFPFYGYNEAANVFLTLKI